MRVRASGELPAQVVAIDVYRPPATRAVVEPSAECQVAEGEASGAERLLLHLGSERRDYRCDVVFVPSAADASAASSPS